jgi:hypothetical protein
MPHLSAVPVLLPSSSSQSSAVRRRSIGTGQHGRQLRPWSFSSWEQTTVGQSGDYLQTALPKQSSSTDPLPRVCFLRRRLPSIEIRSSVMSDELYCVPTIRSRSAPRHCASSLHPFQGSLPLACRFRLSRVLDTLLSVVPLCIASLKDDVSSRYDAELGHERLSISA